MRILYVGDAYFARLGHGAGMADEALCRALVARGHEVRILTVEGPGEVPGLDVASLSFGAAVAHFHSAEPAPTIASSGALRALRGSGCWVTDHGEGDTVYGKPGVQGAVACCASRRAAADLACVAAVVVHPIEPDVSVLPLGHQVVVPGASIAKGGDLALEVARRMPDVSFLLVSTYGVPADGLGRLPNVQVTPPLPPADLIARMAACLFPSRRETWPVAPRLAAMQGRPVVARDLPGVRDSTGQGALYVHGDDPGPWVEALRRALGRGEPFGPVPAIDHAAEVTALVEALAASA